MIARLDMRQLASPGSRHLTMAFACGDRSQPREAVRGARRHSATGSVRALAAGASVSCVVLGEGQRSATLAATAFDRRIAHRPRSCCLAAMPLSARVCTASSIVLRSLSYVLLRWITGRFWPAILFAAALYIPTWHYNDAKLHYLEDGPARTLQLHFGALTS